MSIARRAVGFVTLLFVSSQTPVRRLDLADARETCAPAFCSRRLHRIRREQRGHIVCPSGSHAFRTGKPKVPLPETMFGTHQRFDGCTFTTVDGRGVTLRELAPDAVSTGRATPLRTARKTRAS